MTGCFRHMRMFLLLVSLVPAFSLMGCKGEPPSESEGSISLILGMDKYYADPKYNQFTGPASGRDRILARVNDEAIRREQLDERLVANVDMRLAEGLPVTAGIMDEVRASLLDTLITLTVERQEALRRNFEVSDEELDEVIERFQEEQGGEEKLSQALRDAGISEDKFRRLCEQEVRVLKLRESILSQPVPEPSEEEIWEYYHQKVDEWTRVRASSIFISAPDDLPLLERQKRKQLAERLRNQAMQGADFAQLAQEYSMDERSRDAGGDMGWYPLVGLEPKVRAVIKGLPLGAVSDLVDIDRPDAQGFSIFKMTDIERLTPDDEKVRFAVAGKWKNKKRLERLHEWLVSKRDESTIVILDTKVREVLGL